jgi:hypothetical protein
MEAVWNEAAGRCVVAAPFRPLRPRDVAPSAAAVTFYVGIAVAPVCLLSAIQLG